MTPRLARLLHRLRPRCRLCGAKVWRAMYYTAKDRADRATWGGHLS